MNEHLTPEDVEQAIEHRLEHAELEHQLEHLSEQVEQPVEPAAAPVVAVAEEPAWILRHETILQSIAENQERISAELESLRNSSLASQMSPSEPETVEVTVPEPELSELEPEPEGRRSRGILSHLRRR